MDSTPRIALLMTGNELMSGDTVDSNSAFIARALGEYSLTVTEKVTLGDDPEGLLNALARLCKNNDVLIMNGGLGPTADDLTAELIAQAADTPLSENPEARAHVEAWCTRRRIEPNGANLKQASLPLGATVIPNPVGSAVGFALEVQGCLVLTTPGVPSELRAMMPTVLNATIDRVGGSSADILRLQTFGIGESTVQQRVTEQMPDWPAEVELGFRAGMPQLELKLSIKDVAHKPLQLACRQRLEAAFGDHILGEGDTSLSGTLQQALKARGQTITTAESCTGGLIAAMITREAGASAIFQGGYVTYSNTIKHRLLGVSEQVLATEGAVSEPVVRQMLSGALKLSDADYGIAVSGIAGPDGGSDDKPVGTVWLAWGSSEVVHTRRVLIPGSRELFQTLVAAAGLDLVRRQVLGLPTVPHYFSRQTG